MSLRAKVYIYLVALIALFVIGCISIGPFNAFFSLIVTVAMASIIGKLSTPAPPTTPPQ